MVFRSVILRCEEFAISRELRQLCPFFYFSIIATRFLVNKGEYNMPLNAFKRKLEMHLFEQRRTFYYLRKLLIMCMLTYLQDTDRLSVYVVCNFALSSSLFLDIAICITM